MRNRIQQAFDFVHAETDLCQNTKQYIAHEIQNRDLQRPAKRVPVLRYAVSMVCIVLVFVAFSTYQAYTTEVSAISIDGSASLELGINRFDRVVRVSQFDTMQVEESQLLHKNYVEAVDCVMQQEIVSDAANIPIQIGVTADSAKHGQQILACLSTESPDITTHAHCYEVSPEIAEQATQAGISMGNYKIYLQLQEQYPDLALSDISHLCMQDLMAMLYTEGEIPTSTDMQCNSNMGHHENGHRGNGMGKQYGKS